MNELLGKKLNGLEDKLPKRESTKFIEYSKIKEQNSASENCFFIKKKSKYIRVDFVNIFYISSEGNYVTLHTISEKFVMRTSLKKTLVSLPDYYFVRVHKKFVINKAFVTSVDLKEDKIELSDQVLPIGRSFKLGIRNKILA